MLKRILPFCAAVVLLMTGNTSAVADAAQVSVESAVKEGYSVVSENRACRLYGKLDTGDFAVEDLTSGHIWYSGQWDVMDDESPVSELNTGRIKTDLVSLIGVNYVQISTIAGTAFPSYQNSYAYSVTKGNVKVKKISNGFRASYYFKDIDCTVPLEITLTDNGFSAEIIGSDIKMGNEYWITSIELLPGLMASDNRNKGYLFVPSGSGGIIPLNSGKGDMASYSQMVYGDDTAIEAEEYTGESRNVLVPVYGIKCENVALTAIITKGDSTAKIRADANSSTTSFSRIFSEYVTAIIDKTTLFESDYSNQRIIYGIEKRSEFADYRVEYTFLKEDEANYSGMAKTYREYLNLSSSAEAPKLFMTLYGAATKKASFLGIPYTKTISLTSFEDAESIIKKMNDADVPVSLQYIGWNNSGIENKKIPTKFSPVKVLGGKSGFKDFYKFIENSENNGFFDLDFMTIRSSGGGFSKLSDVCKSIFNTRTSIYKYMRSVYVPVNNEDPSYLMTPENVVLGVEKFLKNYPYESGISLYGIGEQLYSDFSKKGTRAQIIDSYKKVLSKAGKKNSIAVNTGNAYVYPYVERIYSLPMTNDGNLLFSESVPFVQMVLHNAVSYGAEASSSLLDCIEYGSIPYFKGIKADDSTLIETTFNWLSGTTFSNWSDKAIEMYQSWYSVYENLYDKTIISHSSQNGISKTMFDNGAVVYVNKTDKDVTVDSILIQAQGFRVIGGRP